MGPFRTVMIMIIYIGACCSYTALLSADNNQEEMIVLFNEAKKHFARANELVNKDPWQAKDLYNKALLHYENLALEKGIKNGKLYYNIGNTYFKIGDMGKSILFYKKALEYIPNDTNLIQNLEYARSKRVDKISEKEGFKLMKILFFWHYDISAFVRLVFFIISFVLIWVSAVLLFFYSKYLLRLILVIACVFSLLFFGSLLVDIIQNLRQNPGVIIAQEVTARKGDSTTYQPSFQTPLHAGTEFVLIEKRRDWLNIRLTDGRTCWVPEKTAGLVKEH